MKTLYRKIRYAEEVNNPALFSYLLEEVSEGVCNTVEQRDISFTQFQLLLETMSDDQIPNHWRQQCLEHIHKPLFKLQNLAVGEAALQQIKGLFYQLSIKSNELQASL